MPQPPTANMGLITPTDHSDPNVWGPILATLFGRVDEHDHTTGKGVRIPSAALNIDADVSWATHAISNLLAADFVPTTALSVAGFADAWFVSSADNELYWRNHSGTNIQITSGTTLNVASFVGGIGGDYAAVGALLDYDDATDTYRFRQETAAAVRQYAKISIADLIIREYDPSGDATVPANTITIKSPDALAASYSLTFGAALPGTTALVQVSAAGVLTYTNTTTEEITAADHNFTAQQTIRIQASSAQTQATGPVFTSGNWVVGVTTGYLWYPINLRTGDRIKSWLLWLDKDSAAGTIDGGLYEQNSATGASTQIGATQSAGPGALGDTVLTQTGLDHLVTGDTSYYVVVRGGGTTGDSFRDLQVNITHPA